MGVRAGVGAGVGAGVPLPPQFWNWSRTEFANLSLSNISFSKKKFLNASENMVGEE